MPSKGGQDHKKMQALLKKYGQDRGYRATIEKQCRNGSIDVVLEKDGEPAIACEISVTSTPDQEIKNLAKCLRAGYKKVWLISDENATLRRVKEAAQTKFAQDELGCIQFFTLSECTDYLKELAAKSVSGVESTVKGFKVKKNFKAVEQSESDSKKKSVVDTILKSLKRKNGGK